MKTLVLSFISVFAVYTITAQQYDLAFLNTDEVNTIIENVSSLKKSGAVKAKNAEYLTKVSIEQSSKDVKMFERDIANFNLKEHAIFDDSEEATYQIVFNKKRANAVVTYRYTGEVLSTKETYKNIRLPLHLRIKITKEHPGWAFKSNVLTIIYRKGKPVLRTYRVVISDGKREKNLRFKLSNPMT